MSLQMNLVRTVTPVRELAREWGTSCALLLQIASALGMPVSCPSSIVTSEQADRIESVYRRLNSSSRLLPSR
jgi:hypothetical protein